MIIVNTFLALVRHRYSVRLVQLVLLFGLPSANTAWAQRMAEDLPEYPFVQYDKNELQLPGNPEVLYPLFARLDSMILMGTGRINIVHLGGSHIQAGILSAHFARRLQTFYPGLKGSRGFVFPYRMARTNNPKSYRSEYTGAWATCRSTQRKRVCSLGLSGISATTHESGTQLRISPTEAAWALPYSFTRFRVFHQPGGRQFSVRYQPADRVARQYTDTVLGISSFWLRESADTLDLSFVADSAAQQSFTLHGLTLENDDPGITYYPIGVNGSTIGSFLRSELLETHLAAIDPQWIILTLGTNDAYTRRFRPEVYKANYKELLRRLRRAAPQAVVLLTVPNDSYLYRRQANPNTARTAEVIAQLAQEENLAYWNFYEVMGGYNSVQAWYRHQLAGADRIHFSPQGYRLQADLLFAAFVKRYEAYHQAQ